MFSSKYLFLLLVACTSAVAVNYNIEKTPGKPVLLHFKDGRIADLLLGWREKLPKVLQKLFYLLSMVIMGSTL